MIYACSPEKEDILVTFLPHNIFCRGAIAVHTFYTQIAPMYYAVSTPSIFMAVYQSLLHVIFYELYKHDKRPRAVTGLFRHGYVW